VSWEPGLDIHEWQSQWASLEDDIADSPETALPVIHELITRMLQERRILDDNLVVLEGVEPDWIRTWEAGRELVEHVDDPGAEIERQDIVDQLDEYRDLFDALIQQRTPP
jgi:hypothetical protein